MGARATQALLTHVNPAAHSDVSTQDSSIFRAPMGEVSVSSQPMVSPTPRISIMMDDRSILILLRRGLVFIKLKAELKLYKESGDVFVEVLNHGPGLIVIVVGEVFSRNMILTVFPGGSSEGVGEVRVEEKKGQELKTEAGEKDGAVSHIVEVDAIESGDVLNARTDQGAKDLNEAKSRKIKENHEVRVVRGA